jgi:hypothetical protein
MATLEDASKYPSLLLELSRRRTGTDDLTNLVGSNVPRVLRQVEKAAEGMSEKRPLGDTLRPFIGSLAIG